MSVVTSLIGFGLRQVLDLDGANPLDAVTRYFSDNGESLPMSVVWRAPTRGRVPAAAFGMDHEPGSDGLSELRRLAEPDDGWHLWHRLKEAGFGRIGG